MNSTHQITDLLHAWNMGDAEALNQLIPLADRELKNIARSYMARERANHLLAPTDLIDEAWLKLFREEAEVDWKNRKHFYALLALRMRQVLYDHARRRRNAELVRLTGASIPPDRFDEIIKVNQTLDDLAKINKRAAEIVELRYFGGYTVEDVAKILDVGTKTVERESRFARAWLWRQINMKDS